MCSGVGGAHGPHLIQGATGAGVGIDVPTIGLGSHTASRAKVFEPNVARRCQGGVCWQSLYPILRLASWVPSLLFDKIRCGPVWGGAGHGVQGQGVAFDGLTG